jgi:lipid II:glycine glycyltransferase (peptidoglycan interpeptide bridge formation enzyme)
LKIHLESKSVVALFPTDILFQTTFWSRVKSRLGWNALAFDIDCPVQNGDVLVLTKHFGCNASTAYIPQGPEISPDPENYGPFLEEFSENLIEHLDPSVTFIRYDLPWKSPYQNVDDGHSWEGHPQARLRELRMNFGTKSWNLRKASVDMTVADSLVVDIRGPEEEILRKMKPKTQYNIRLAGRKEVVVEPASVEMLPAFYDLYCQTAKRNGFVICDFRYFAALFSEYLLWAGTSKILFLLARRGSALLAGGIFAISGKTAHYLFGASSRDHKSLMGPYALHWEAIRCARTIGCNRYDMGAVSPTKDPDHPFYGLLRFKTGFGGEVIHRNGSWDYPIDHDAYRAFCNSEMLSREKMI